MNKHSRPDGVDLAARSRARRRALQAVYAWQVSGNSMARVIEEFRHEQDMEVADLDYFEDLLRGVNEHCAALDSGLAPFLDREVAQIDPIERAVLRIAAFELKFRPDVPYRVVINEGIELAKVYGSTDGHKFVNGVLDKLAPRLREAEVKEHKR